jgi:ABC-type multidrug transport system ATPase subunit
MFVRGSAGQQLSGCGDTVTHSAGKTTFLNTLAGRAYYGVQSGEILYNGVVHAPAKVKGLSGFVPQDDIVHEDLTVYENIAMAHRLRVGFHEARAEHNLVYEVRSSHAAS